MPHIVWFRQDLRIADNPSLYTAAQKGEVLPLYILDEDSPGEHVLGSASRVWLYHSLRSLSDSLNGNLWIKRGDPMEILHDLCTKYNIESVSWNRCYEPWSIKRDTKIKSSLKENGICVETHNGSLLWEPWDILKSDQTPYRVFTPFYKKGCLNAKEPRQPLPAPSSLKFINKSEDIETFNLLPEIQWDKKLISHWPLGEEGAQQKLRNFLDHGLKQYKEGRDFPCLNNTSRLSPYLHFGEISPQQVWHVVRSHGYDKNIEHFCSELGWREFSYNLLYNNPELPTKNLQKKFDFFPWRADQDDLQKWKNGQTSIPIVDAGMRELWQTGYMHNRVRMIVGSFLVKNLRLHWHHGEKWFWDCLVDADLANNSSSWQWIAGCGADAAPYFRIFNPVTQGQKFDPEGLYTRRYVPELKNIPNKYLFNLWDAPAIILKEGNIKLGETYPKPIVDLKKSREEALEAFQSLKGVL